MSSAPTEAAKPELIWLREEPCSRNPGHSWARIAAAAIAIADRDGFEAVSMRRVAQELGAGTMTLYHYVANKDDLVSLMTDAVMGEVLVPEDELPRRWRPAIARIATETRQSLRRHRWMLDLLGDHRPGPNGLRHFEQSLQAMSSLDIPRKEKFEAIVLIDEYVFGFAIREAQEGYNRRPWEREKREFFSRELDRGDFPQIRAFFEDDVDAARQLVTEVFLDEQRFERGLNRLLDGIEAALPAESDS